MHVDLGFDAYALSQRQQHKPVRWESRAAINGHWLICGGSGTGKTYTVRRVLQALQETVSRRLRIHIFDVHGDLEIPGASSVRFSEASPHGFNPLVINPDLHWGGVRRRVQAFVAAINRTSRELGSKQEAVLRAILTDLYAANGFYSDKPASWRLQDGVSRKFPKKYPSIVDAIRFATAKLRALYMGADAATVVALEDLNGHVRRMQHALRAANRATVRGDAEGAQQKDALLESLRAKAIDAFTRHVEKMTSGRELDDHLKYDSKDVLKSVVDRLENLNALGIFKSSPPPFDPSATVWRYDITSVPADEAKLFVSFRLEAIFAEAMQAGEQSDITDVIVLDEAHRYASSSKDDDTNPIDTVTREGRKFGLALIGVSQSPGHFSEDFLSNVATKVILGLDELHWDASTRKLKIPEKTLRFIRPKRTMAVQIKASGDTRNAFTEVQIG
jgi:DNA helicase HerA-like ATPase